MITTKAIRRLVLRKGTAENAVKIFLSSIEKAVFKGLEGLTEEIYDYITGRYNAIDEKRILNGVKTRLEQYKPDLDLSRLDIIYESTAFETEKEIKNRIKKSGFVFNELDEDTLQAIRKNFFWLQDNSSVRVREKLFGIVETAFKGDITREDIPGYLEAEFGSALKQEVRYFKDVSDHIISQGQNLSRIRQGQKYGVENYQILAVIDESTTQICRSMNKRIIPAKHLENQADMIQEAYDVNEKKKAAPWRTKAFLGKSSGLDKNFGLPPYHFRCRTIAQPVWIDEQEVLYKGKTFKVKNTGRPAKGEIFRHIDNTGVERVLDESAFEHSAGAGQRRNETDKLVSALNSIKVMGVQENGRHIAMSENGYIEVFNGDKVWTFFKPLDSKGRPNSEKYFKRQTLKNTKEVIKWEKENYLSGLIKGISGRFMMRNTRV
jgi:hypothetical protein